jgi:hypothetical protein
MTQPTDPTPAAPAALTVSILERRRIEALFAKAMLRTLAQELGEAPARALMKTAVTAMAHEAGSAFAAANQAEKGRAPTLGDYAEILPLWQQDDALRISFIERSAERLSFNVTRCRYAEMYRELGLAELGDTLSCNRDGEFCVGYNPAITLTRTQTIMGGAAHCDFRYTIAPAAQAEAAPPGAATP